MLPRYDRTSSVPIFKDGFAGGMLGAAARHAMGGFKQEPAGIEADQSGTTESDGKLTSIAEAKKTLSENGLVPDEVLNNSDILKDRTNEYGLFKGGESRGVLSLDEVSKFEADGWRRIEGSANKGGVINIFKQATFPGHESHTGLFGRTLTGQQNLVQTIYHEYQHYIGALHGKTPGTFACNHWGRKEGAALAPVFDR